MSTADSNLPQPEGKRIKVQTVRASRPKMDVRALLAQVCYYYPQYTLKEAQKLPYRDVKLLLNVAMKMKAMEYYNLTQISAAPHTKGGKGVTKLSEHFKKVADS